MRKVAMLNSFRKMTMIFMTIPLGVTGMVLGLMCYGVLFGFRAFLGVSALTGKVINNAIVLATFTTVQGLVPL